MTATLAPPHAAPTPRARPRLQAGTWALLAVCLLAAALRFYRIDAQSLWYDEGISAFQLTRSFPDIARAAGLDTHPPLYYWTLKVWGSLPGFGTTELGLRSLSAVLGVAAVALTWIIGRRLFGGALPATCAALLLACSPLAVYYGQEVRMYAQVIALGLLAALAYLQRRFVLYVPCAAAAIYSHYLGLTLLAALNLHALLWRRSLDRRQWLGWLAANLAVALIFLPWLPTFLDQLRGRSFNTAPRTTEGLALDTLGAYGGGLARGQLETLAGVALILLALLGLALTLRRSSPVPGQAKGEQHAATAATLALLLWLLPLADVVTFGLRSGLFELRYLSVSVPGLALLAGAAVARLARLVPAPARIPLAAALLLPVLGPAADALQREYFDPALARDDYRGLVQAIERQAQPGDAVILAAPNQIEVFSFYYHGPLAVFPLPAQRPIDVADTRQRLEAIRAQHPRVWLVSWAIREADPGGFMDDWFAHAGFPSSHAWFGTLQLYLIAFPQLGQTTPLNVTLDNGIDLLGYRLNARTLQPGDTVALTLSWRAAAAAPVGRWKVFTHLLDGRSQVVAQRDAEPADGLRPTTDWRPGEQVDDNYGIAIPADLPPGDYTLEIGMYQYEGERRAEFVGRGDHLSLGPITVSPR